jgi:hypothetical protein
MNVNVYQEEEGIDIFLVRSVYETEIREIQLLERGKI